MALVEAAQADCTARLVSARSRKIHLDGDGSVVAQLGSRIEGIAGYGTTSRHPTNKIRAAMSPQVVDADLRHGRSNESDCMGREA